MIWAVIQKFATRPNAEGFIRDNQTRRNAKYYGKPLLLVLDSEAKDKMWWMIITEQRNYDE